MYRKPAVQQRGKWLGSSPGDRPERGHADHAGPGGNGHVPMVPEQGSLGSCPVNNAAAPAVTAARRLASGENPIAKMMTDMPRTSRLNAARRDDCRTSAALPEVGGNDPITDPQPSAAIKYPGHSPEICNFACASAGLSTSIGSSASVTAATMASRSRIRGCRSAVWRPSDT
jgi:hypothetical protein